MKRNAVVSASLILLILSCSLPIIAVVHSQSSFRDVNRSQQLVFSMPLVLGASVNTKTRLLNQSTRMEIFNLVKNNPGIHFRGICDKLGLSVGVVQYHLNLLVSAGLLFVCIDGRYKRFFESSMFTETDIKIISLLRKETVRKILRTLLDDGAILHKGLVRKLGISSQALTWQMSQLKRTGLVKAVKEEKSVRYFLNEEKAINLRRCVNLI